MQPREEKRTGDKEEFREEKAIGDFQKRIGKFLKIQPV